MMDQTNPKDAFFKKSGYNDVVTPRDIYFYMMSYQKRTYINSADAKGIATVIFRLPIDVLRSESPNWRYPNEQPKEMSSVAKLTVSSIYGLTHDLRERIRSTEISKELTILQKVRIAKKWLISNFYSENYTVSDMMVRFTLVCSSLGMYMDDMIKAIVNNTKMKKLDKHTEFLLMFLENTIAFCEANWGKMFTMLEAIQYTMDELKWYTGRHSKAARKIIGTQNTKKETKMAIDQQPDYSEDILYIAIKKAIDDGAKTAALGRYKDNQVARTIASNLQPIVDKKYQEAFGDKIVIGVEEENGEYYVVAYVNKLLPCGGKLDAYCKKCGIFHFDLEGLSQAEKEIKKKEIYANHYEQTKSEKSIRSKGDDQT